jgi:hypothetical protein
MWPDTDPDTVQAIWDAAAAVGFRAGKFTAAGRWNTDHLQQARQALAATGHHHMAAALDNAMACAPSQHPADHDQHTTRPRTDDTAWESHA